MKLTSSEEYGLRCLLQIARLSPNGKSTTIAEISNAEKLSVPLVAKYLRVLRQEGFVNSARGQAGGYALSRLPEEISIAEVLTKLGGKFFDLEFCDRHAGELNHCVHTTDCSIRALLRGLQQVMDDFLQRVTLGDLLSKEKEMKIFLEPQIGSIDP